MLSSPSLLPRRYENKQEPVTGAFNSINVLRKRRQIKIPASIFLVKVTPHRRGGLHQLYFLQYCQPVLWILFLLRPWKTHLIGSGFYLAWEPFMISRIKYKGSVHSNPNWMGLVRKHQGKSLREDQGEEFRLLHTPGWGLRESTSSSQTRESICPAAIAQVQALGFLCHFQGVWGMSGPQFPHL